MLKKFLIGSVLLAGTSGLLLGTSTVSYVRTGFHSLRNSVKDQIPIEVEITRARDLITNLKPEIAENLKRIAREEVEVAKLQREVSTKETALTQSKDAILKLKDDVESGVKYVTYRGKKYSAEQIRCDLSDRFKHHQSLEQTADKLAKILDARERNLVAARRKLDEMLSTKRELEVQIENLQARLTMVQVAQAGSEFAVDDGAIGQVRQALDEITTRIDVAEKLVQGSEHLGMIPVEPQSGSNDMLEQISEYFGADQSRTLDEDPSAESVDHLAENFHDGK